MAHLILKLLFGFGYRGNNKNDITHLDIDF